MFRSSIPRAIAIVGILVAVASAQNDSGMSTTGAGTHTQSSEPELTLSATKIVEFLNERPDVLVELKSLAAEKLSAEGVAIQENEISDEDLYSRIASDAKLRSTVSIWLVARGYFSKAELQSPSVSRFDNSLSATSDDAVTNSEITNNATSRRLGSGDNGIESDETQQPFNPNVSDRSAYPGPTRVRSLNSGRTKNAPPQPEPAPQVLRRDSPYNLMALRDLYTQIPEQRMKLRRFGSEFFLSETLPASPNLIDLPMGPDYVLGPGDSITINVWGGVSLTVARLVDREGKVILPEAGPVQVAGLRMESAQKLIEQKLAPQFRNAHVNVSLSRVRTVRVYVVGDVQRPGAYEVSSLSTPLNALLAAGGPTFSGSLRFVKHMRGTRLLGEVDLYDLMIGGIRADLDRLEPGDTILVPPVGTQVTVSGMVKRPAIYEFRGQETLAKVIELAGGLRVGGSTDNIRIERIDLAERRVTLSVSVPHETDSEAMSKALSSYVVKDGDIISIAPILAYSEKTIYLDGHVFRPGRLSYHDGMTVTDIIRSYQDLLPEPADHAEIVRLAPPDFHPTTIQFSLKDAMLGNDPIELQPFDTVRVFGRYEIDAPKVAIHGEVLRPGEYPLVRGMSASDLVRAAGGFKRSALRDKADITSYDLKGGKNVDVRHTTINIENALDGIPDTDVRLKPGDILTVFQIAGWKEIGASVTLNGEVQYPGTYGIQDGEKLSSVIRRAGGFRSSAYPAGAVLERVQVRELQEKSKIELIRQIEIASSGVKPIVSTSVQEQAGQLQLVAQQQHEVLEKLKSQPASGRLVISISPDIADWQDTPADVEVRAGDNILIPKRPTFVLVSGQVNNPSAITFAPGKSANWYLHQAGGATELANRKHVFIVRANGSVIAENSNSWFGGSVLDYRMQPGDVVVLPQKIIGGSTVWKSLLNTAQFLSSVSISARLAAAL